MHKIIDKLTMPLDKSDIELRIGIVNKRGFSLLLYKTARTDVRKLIESGAVWKNTHQYDASGLMTCTISIYDTENRLWVDRTDVGKESRTEAEKGMYSDSFKRAGFRWGVGLELYTAPFIWINWETDGKKPKNFYPSNLIVEEYAVEKGRIVKLLLSYQGEIIYSYGTSSKSTATKELVILDEIANIYENLDLTNKNRVEEAVHSVRQLYSLATSSEDKKKVKEIGLKLKGKLDELNKDN